MDYDLDFRTVPIERWPDPPGLTPEDERKEHPFRYQTDRGAMRPGVDWQKTKELLDRELSMLDAENIVLQMALDDSQITIDGRPYARARPDHPGVILSFDSKFGPLQYPCDTFTDWQANVRAIAIALENLRRVDRYGVSRRGEQYTGWKKLPPAGGTTTTMTAEAAACVLLKWAGEDPDDEEMVEALLQAPASLADRIRRDAMKAAHPDRGGNGEAFHAVATAWKVLQRHRGEDA